MSKFTAWFSLIAATMVALCAVSSTEAADRPKRVKTVFPVLTHEDYGPEFSRLMDQRIYSSADVWAYTEIMVRMAEGAYKIDLSLSGDYTVVPNTIATATIDHGIMLRIDQVRDRGGFSSHQPTNGTPAVLEHGLYYNMTADPVIVTYDGDSAMIDPFSFFVFGVLNPVEGNGINGDTNNFAIHDWGANAPPAPNVVRKFCRVECNGTTHYACCTDGINGRNPICKCRRIGTPDEQCHGGGDGAENCERAVDLGSTTQNQ